MIRIKRVYLENFKAVKGPEVIEMNSNSSIFMGPNGFGKTTIFDAIELCVTNTIHRTKTTKVTNDIKDYSKPFFQNEIEKDVCIKVWFENENSDDLIIVRYYEHGKQRKFNGRKNKPTDFDSLFDLYTQSSAEFDNRINMDNVKKIQETDISNYFGLKNEEHNLSDIYKLFVYLQQEETTFFLKQSESERRDSLGFLFESSNQDEMEKQITSHITMFNKAVKNLEKQKENLRRIQPSEEVYYEEIFSWIDDEILDNVDPFKNSTTESLSLDYEEIVNQLTNIQEFISNFSPIEYQKKRLDDFFTQQICTKEFCSFFVLEHFLSNSEFLHRQKEVRKIMINKDYPARIIIDLLNINGKQLAIEAEKHQFITSILEEQNLFDLKVVRLERYLKIVGFNEQSIEYFNKCIEDKKVMEDKLSLLDKKISDINRIRDSLKNSHHHSEEVISSECCPYCGTDWTLKEKLDEAYEELTLRLTKENIQIHDSINKLEEDIANKFFVPAKNSADIILKKLKIMPTDFIEFIQENQGKKLNQEILTDMKNNLNLEHINKQYQSLNEMNDVIEELSIEVCKQWLVPSEVVNLFETLNNKDYSEQKQFLYSNFDIESLSDYQIPINMNITMQKCNEAIYNFEIYLQSLRKHFSYDTAKVFDKKNIYEIIFNKSKENFYVLTQENLKRKANYLYYKFSEANNNKIHLISSRISLLNKAIEDLKDVQKVYKKQIALYKKNMVQVLKVPFFIISGKILQNYQQGIGVFINFSDNGSIRFITDQTSNHDAMHHLSTGQISVISLAFTLACKKCYKVARKMDFLVIDDPIQDMDSLNIQSFTDVLRRNYLMDNQIILSTHSDDDAALTKYKFERIGIDNNVNLIDVQELFFY